jgi:hypothetical protein
MAKKSKSSKIDIQAIGLGLLGAVAAGKVAKLNIPVPEKAKPFLPLAAGIALMMTKNAQLKAAGLGMAIYGGTRALNATIPALGLAGDESMGDYMIEGPDYALAGPDTDGTMIGAATTTSSSFALAGVDEMTSDDFVG